MLFEDFRISGFKEVSVASFGGPGLDCEEECEGDDSGLRMLYE